MITEKIKKNDWQNWNFQNCFPHISWKPVQKIKIYIFAKISSRTIIKYLPICSISFDYGENQKNWLTKLKFPKLFYSYFMKACSKKNKNLFYAKISSRTILQSVQFRSILFGYGENQKKMIDKIEISKIVFLIFHESLFQKNKNLYFCKDIVQDYFTVSTILFYLIWLRIKSKKLIDNIEISKLLSSYFMKACSKKIKIYIFAKISSRTILKYLQFCSISFGYGQNQKNWLTKLKFPKLFSSYFMKACSKKIKIYFMQRYRPGLFYSLYNFVLSYFVKDKIKKIDWQNWNFQNCFPHISWKSVPKE